MEVPNEGYLRQSSTSDRGGMSGKKGRTMKMNVWTVTTGIFMAMSFAYLWLAYHHNDVARKSLQVAEKWKAQAEESQRQVDRALAVAKDFQVVAEGWRSAALGTPVDVADRYGSQPAEEETKDDSNTLEVGPVIEQSFDFTLSNDVVEDIVKMTQSYADIIVTTADGDVRFMREDPNSFSSPYRITEDSVRRLCTSGRVCAVLGHQWDIEFINLPTSINGGPYGPGEHEEKCCICGRVRNRKYVTGHWEDWKEPTTERKSK